MAVEKWGIDPEPSVSESICINILRNFQTS